MANQEKIQKAVEKFHEVRDMPFHISMDGEAEYDCEGKARLLAKELQSLGYKPFLRASLFHWSDLELPEEINSIGHEDESTHWFLEVENLDGESVFVDPTWNPELEKAGFLISEWDGIGSTSLTTPCYRIFSRKESEEHLKTVKYPDDDFYDAFNKYCDSFLEGGKVG